LALSYNNQAYAALLAGAVADARTTIELGIDFVMRNELMRPRQYLYSTQGEIALAAGDLDEAERSLTVAHDEAHVYDNFTHAANIQANLGRVALARGEYALAQTRLLDAYAAVPDAGANHLRIQIELWLAHLYLACEDVPTARRYLDAARGTLADSGRAALQAEADALAEALAARMAEA
jgi:ATP/maltotriose-dependent transcriptional regulator MalT